MDDLALSFGPTARVAYTAPNEPVRGEFQAEGREAIRLLFLNRTSFGEILTVQEIETFDRPLGGGHIVVRGRLPDGHERTLDGKFQYSCADRALVSLVLTPLAQPPQP